MKRFVSSSSTVRLIASFVLLAAGLFAGSKAANAASITEVSDSQGSGTIITYAGSGTLTLSGGDTGTSALAYTTDYIEFVVSGGSGENTTVVVNAATPYPSSTYMIGTTTTNGSILGATLSNNTPVAITLLNGTDYFMSFSSTAPAGTGSQSFGIVVTPAVPEIDPQNATSALALLIGAVLVIRGRRWKMLQPEHGCELGLA